jgi:shikimate kinase
MPGAGKTTFARKLATHLNREFVDLDDVIEKQSDMSVAKIFSELGEPNFRIAEKRALESTLQDQNLIISTGGGTPCFHENMAQMNKFGITIFLDPPLDILVQRISSDLKERPLLDNSSSLTEVLEKTYVRRKPWYEKAQFTFQDPMVTPEEVVAALESKTNS